MPANANDSGWTPVHIGAGGFLTGIDVAPDGTMVARTDTYGAYIWNGAGWTQLVTSSSMPANIMFSYGVYELRVSASNSNVMYMEMADGIYKSVDKGQHWLKTPFPAVIIDPNGYNRMDGQKMAIDPNNPNIVFAGTQHDGLWVTRDGGTSWQKVAAVPQGPSNEDPALTGIVVHGSNVFVGTAGSGVYTSHDGGYTWTAIGGPADLSFGVASPDGSYFATDDTGLWKYANGSWIKLLNDPNIGVHSVSIDPFNTSHIIITNDGGSLQSSNDGGATWSGMNWFNQLESKHDVPWLENSGRYMGSGGTIFDPLVQGKLWQSAGVGVWETQLPAAFEWTTPIIWHSQSQGIEQLVANDIIAPAGGNPVFGSWDRAFFEMPDVDTYASGYSGGQFSMGWSLDYASSNSRYVVGISDWWGSEDSGFSTDGGKTWQKFATYPSFAGQTIGGSIAASTPTNIVWAPANGFAPAYTLDGGTTWHTVNIPEKTSWNDFHFAYYLERTTITADRVLPNTFYLYDCMSGVYRSSDGGVNWVKVFAGEVSIFSGANAKIEAVPGSAGELFFTSGPQGSDGAVVPGLITFMHSKDGGASWQPVAGVQAITFGYGAPAAVGGPATVFLVGTVNGKYGVWYSADDTKSWIQIGEHPMGSLDTIRTISGDMDVFGRAYIGFGGSGYAYLDVSVSPPLVQAGSPPTQSVIIDNALDDVGGAAVVHGGALINDATPTLRGTLSAPLGTDQMLSIYRDGQKIGTIANPGNSWSFTDLGASDGSHAYTARVETSAGQQGPLSASFALIIDSTAPAQRVTVASVLDDAGAITGTLQSEATTDDTSPVIRGGLSSNLATGESVIVYRDGTRLGTAKVTNGEWSFADTGVATGAHVYTTRVEDAAGNVGSVSNGFMLTVGADAPSPVVLTGSLPTQYVIIDNVLDDVGGAAAVHSGALINDATPTLRGTLSGPLGSDQLLAIYRDGQKMGTIANPGSSWSFTDQGASDGSHAYTARVETSAGQHGPLSAPFALIIDSTAPVQRVTVASVLDDAGAITGSLQNEATTDDTSPIIRGGLSSNLLTGESVIVVRDGIRLGTAKVTNGDWSFADNGVATGAHVYTARVEDAAGNSGPVSNGFLLSVGADPVPVPVPVVAPTPVIGVPPVLVTPTITVPVPAVPNLVTVPAHGITVSGPRVLAGETLQLEGYGSSVAAGGWTSDDRYPRMLADVNGDGRTDIIGFGNDGVFVSLGTSSATFATRTLVTPSFGAADGAGGWFSNNIYLRTMADVNGDGRADIVGFGNSGTYVSLGTSTGGFGQITLVTPAFGAAASSGGWFNNDLYLRQLADVNGDGRADVVGFGNAGVYVALGNATGGFANPFLATPAYGAAASSGGWSSNNLYLRQLADVNGDGRADVIGFGNTGVYVSLATAAGSFAAPILALNQFGVAASAGAWVSDNLTPRELADVNGDHKLDIVGFGSDGVYIALGHGDGTFSAATLDLHAFGLLPSAGGWSSEDLYPRHLADVNYDGAADVIGFFNDGVHVALSSSDMFI